MSNETTCTPTTQAQNFGISPDDERGPFAVREGVPVKDSLIIASVLISCLADDMSSVIAEKGIVEHRRMQGMLALLCQVEALVGASLSAHGRMVKAQGA